MKTTKQTALQTRLTAINKELLTLRESHEIPRQLGSFLFSVSRLITLAASAIPKAADVRVSRALLMGAEQMLLEAYRTGDLSHDEPQWVLDAAAILRGFSTATDGPSEGDSVREALATIIRDDMADIAGELVTVDWAKPTGERLLKLARTMSRERGHCLEIAAELSKTARMAAHHRDTERAARRLDELAARLRGFATDAPADEFADLPF